MPDIEENPRRHESIMVVDDSPANLKLLEDTLRQVGYEVRSFPRGRLALAAVERQPPSVILLDINMPEMDGYEVCGRLKADRRFAQISVIFLSALDATEDKVKAFQSGGVDYISKPFQFEEVHARVETHLKLQRARKAEQQLLEQTLNGSMKVLSDIMHITSPTIAARSRAIRDVVSWIVQRMSIPDPWQYELAATLCLMGCVTLPEDTFQKVYAGQQVSPAEAEMFRAHPESAARLLSNIPRLEPVAKMIQLQQSQVNGPGVSSEIKLGAQMLNLAIEVDQRIYRRLAFPDALNQMKSMSGRFNTAMLNHLDTYLPAPAESYCQSMQIRDLVAGLVLEEDIVSSTTGILILKKETVLTGTWIERLENFSKSQGIKEPVRVRVPSPECAPAMKTGRLGGLLI